MAIVSIYLNFDGNCEEAFNFYKDVFNCEITEIFRYGDIPRKDGIPELSDEEKSKIENIGIHISKETFLLGSDSIEAFGQKYVAGNNFSIYVTTETNEEAVKIFTGLSESGIVKMPMTKAHWGDYFGMCTDKFGITWL